MIAHSLEDAAKFQGRLRRTICCCHEPRMTVSGPLGKAITRRNWCSPSLGLAEIARTRRCCCPWMSPAEAGKLFLLSDGACWRSSRRRWFSAAGIREPSRAQIFVAIKMEQRRLARNAARPRRAPRRKPEPRPEPEPGEKRPRGRPRKVMLPEAYGD